MARLEEELQTPTQYLDSELQLTALSGRTRHALVEAAVLHRTALGASHTPSPLHTPRSLVFDRWSPPEPLRHGLPVFMPRNVSDYAVTKGDLEALPFLFQRLEDAVVLVLHAALEAPDVTPTLSSTALFWDLCKAASFNRDGSLHFNVFSFEPLLRLESPLPALARVLVNVAHELAHDTYPEHDLEHTQEQEHLLAALSPRVWSRAAALTAWSDVVEAIRAVPVVVPHSHHHARDLVSGDAGAAGVVEENDLPLPVQEELEAESESESDTAPLPLIVPIADAPLAPAAADGEPAAE